MDMGIGRAVAVPGYANLLPPKAGVAMGSGIATPQQLSMLGGMIGQGVAIARPLDPKKLADLKIAGETLLTGRALFAGDHKASIQDVMDVANGKSHVHNGIRYIPSPAEQAAARCLLNEKMERNSKGERSLLDLIEGPHKGFTDAEMGRVINGLPSA